MATSRSVLRAEEHVREDRCGEVLTPSQLKDTPHERQKNSYKVTEHYEAEADKVCNDFWLGSRERDRDAEVR
jgi:hypothetical protein